MSYCRWSSDRFQCDLYCYEDVSGGWTTHVASRRREPIPDDIIEPYSAEALELLTYGQTEWKQINARWSAALEAAPFRDIVSPHAGKSYNDPTLQAFRARIVELAADPGLNVPIWLLPAIDEEIKEKEECHHVE